MGDQLGRGADPPRDLVVGQQGAVGVLQQVEDGAALVQAGVAAVLALQRLAEVPELLGGFAGEAAPAVGLLALALHVAVAFFKLPLQPGHLQFQVAHLTAQALDELVGRRRTVGRRGAGGGRRFRGGGDRTGTAGKIAERQAGPRQHDSRGAQSGLGLALMLRLGHGEDFGEFVWVHPRGRGPEAIIRVDGRTGANYHILLDWASPHLGGAARLFLLPPSRAVPPSIEADRLMDGPEGRFVKQPFHSTREGPTAKLSVP
ncbi:protein of unknown function [Azospirillum baldaniorum]|uniref:Uncharacterized protein n=1 Tax=Azospirillum baldaniorum TaxID=1064539 RepID=A0A9P1JNE6_9PROT|nr:protein of unknown function [Azospirillum baldaniorum]